MRCKRKLWLLGGSNSPRVREQRDLNGAAVAGAGARSAVPVMSFRFCSVSSVMMAFCS